MAAGVAFVKHSRRVVVVLLGCLALALILLGARTVLPGLAWWSGARAPGERAAMLRPGYRVFTPDGPGPFPTALLFSGCDGPKDNLERMAATLNASGWAAVSVDSHGPRGFGDASLWRLVCAGQLLPGPERAGDVAVALADVRRMEFADPERLALIGASHGGWAILDMLALHGRRRLPVGLSAWPDGSGGTLKGVRAAVLLYPYCGLASEAGRHGWSAGIPMLFVLVEHDTIADEEDCRRIMAEMTAQGRPVEELLLQGVTHGFDQEEKAPLSTLTFDPEAAAAARARIMDFLARAGARSK